MSMSQNDVKRALLGDHEAAKRLTEAGVMVPCPFCNGSADIEYDTIEPYQFVAYCQNCGVYEGTYDTEKQARLAWNTRAPILSSEEMEKLSHG